MQRLVERFDARHGLQKESRSGANDLLEITVRTHTRAAFELRKCATDSHLRLHFALEVHSTVFMSSDHQIFVSS